MELQERLNAVRAHIAAAERQAGRPAGAVQLVAVSKIFDAEAIRPAMDTVRSAIGEVPAMLGELRSALGVP